MRWSVVASLVHVSGRPTPSRRLLTLFTLRAAATRLLLSMAKSSTRRSHAKSNSTLRPRPTVCPAAAGIDLGTTEHFVAVPPERDLLPVRSFTTDTAALRAPLLQAMRQAPAEHLPLAGGKVAPDPVALLEGPHLVQ